MYFTTTMDYVTLRSRVKNQFHGRAIHSLAGVPFLVLSLLYYYQTFLHNRKKLRPSRRRPTRVGVIMNRVANQFRGRWNSITIRPRIILPFKKKKKKGRKDTHYEECRRDGWYTTYRVSNQFQGRCNSGDRSPS